MGYEVDFLPVGDGEKSGDAIALRFGNLFGPRSEQTVVVIDGGFKSSGEALVQHIRRYYGTNIVDLAISTHPDGDHSSGLEIVLNELDVKRFWMHQPWNHTDDIARMFRDGRVTDTRVSEALRRSLETACNLESIALAKQIPIFEPFGGLSHNGANGLLLVLGPTQTYYESLLPLFRGTPEPKDLISLIEKALREVVKKVAEWWDHETLDDSGEVSAENNSSTILLLVIDGHCLLFTGDAGIPALTEVVDRLESIDFDFLKIIVIQVPHHGSKRNVGPTILNRLIGPILSESQEIKTAYVSVSSEGEPKHPAKKVTNAFKRRGAPVHATKGVPLRYSYNAPNRGWGPSIPLPFYSEVDE